MRSLAFTLIVLMTSAAAATTVYRWVDASGVVHFSDQPHENAEKLTVQEPQTYSAHAPGLPSAASPAAPGAPARSCSIERPTPEQMLMNTDSVTVNVRTAPPQNGDESEYVLLDGQRVSGVPTRGPTFTLSPVERGQHSVAAQLVDAAGQILCQTAPVTFYVHQPSVQNPQNPTRRH